MANGDSTPRASQSEDSLQRQRLSNPTAETDLFVLDKAASQPSRALVVLHIAGDQPHELAIDIPRQITIGRGSECQIQLTNDPEASRFHCRLAVAPPHCRVVDLVSRNGT